MPRQGIAKRPRLCAPKIARDVSPSFFTQLVVRLTKAGHNPGALPPKPAWLPKRSPFRVRGRGARRSRIFM
jgi:hypothetical protein